MIIVSFLQVNTNGILSFWSRFTSPFRRSFPFFSVPLIAPYWDNVDTRRFGNIFYRQTTDTNLLQRARNQLQELFPSAGNFTPTYLFIATWDRVAQRFGGSQVQTTHLIVFVSFYLATVGPLSSLPCSTQIERGECGAFSHSSHYKYYFAWQRLTHIPEQ